MARYHGPGHQYICLKVSRKINKFNFEDGYQGVTKRCRLPKLTNRALVLSPKCGGMGGGGVAGSQPMNTAVLMESK
jgi:hypothetical protein